MKDKKGNGKSQETPDGFSPYLRPSLLSALQTDGEYQCHRDNGYVSDETVARNTGKQGYIGRKCCILGIVYINTNQQNPAIYGRFPIISFPNCKPSNCLLRYLSCIFQPTGKVGWRDTNAKLYDTGIPSPPTCGYGSKAQW